MAVLLAVSGGTMDVCYYHAENQSEMVCPDCMMAICAQCLEDGNGVRCGSCRFYMEDSGGATFAQAASEPVAHDDDYGSFSYTSYSDEPPPSVKPGPVTPSGKASGKGKKKGKRFDPWPWLKQGAKVLSILAVVSALAFGGMKGYKWYKKHEADKKKKHKPVPIALTIKQPAKNAVVSHNYRMVFDVASPKHIKSVDVKIDGRYWGRMRRAPFTLDWQTSLFPNGNHRIDVTATYADGRKVNQVRAVRVRNVY